MQTIVADLGMSMETEQLREFMSAADGLFGAYDLVAALPDEKPIVRYARTPGQRPPSDENAHNGWYVKSEIKGASSGPLSGKTVAIKDNIAVAGVPMMNGSATLEGYVPDFDATVVSRVLDAGGTIAGKTNCELFCMSGGSHTNATGPAHNPHKMGYSAGGSSSGNGIVVALGEVDMALGTDQGGSVRMPASFCGIYGMKPTHGLVPYTGAMPIEATMDHIGPMTRTVEDNALLLEVVAGRDGLDPRQYEPRTANYTAAIGGGVKGLKIGVVREGFGHPSSEADVDKSVRDYGKRLGDLGAEVHEISIPMHLQSLALWIAIAAEGMQWQMMRGNGAGKNWEGFYPVSLIDAHSAWRQKVDQLSVSVKMSMMVGEYFTRHHNGRFYAKAQNITRRLRAAYDDALQRCDLLLMPSTPMKATPLPEPDASLAFSLQRSFEPLANTAAFDLTNHPAMSVPCGMSDGLPIGAMLVGRHYDEFTIYRAADAASR
jgi:amidase